MDNRGKSTANTCIKSRLFSFGGGERMYLLDSKNQH